MRLIHRRIPVAMALILVITLAVPPQVLQAQTGFEGYVESSFGARASDDGPIQDRNVLEESRLLIEKDFYGNNGEVLNVGILATTDPDRNQSEIELREGSIFLPLSRSVELKAGRQVLSWGPSQFEFINDHFAKDFRSFFVGRDLDFLKAPNDAAKLSYYGDMANIDLVVTPSFEPDRLPAGDVIPVYDPRTQQLVSSVPGADTPPRPRRPESSLDNGEIHLRMNKMLGRWEAALYGYRGFIGQPSAFDRSNPYHAELASAGFSLRGPMMGGVVWAEGSYDDVREDGAGDTGNLPPSRANLGVGMRYRTAPTVNYMVQAISSWQIDAAGYRSALGPDHPGTDRVRHRLQVATTRDYWSDRLTVEMRGFAGLTEEDWHARLKGTYEYSDAVTLSSGVLLYGAGQPTSRFGVLDEHDLAFARLRYGF